MKRVESRMTSLELNMIALNTKSRIFVIDSCVQNDETPYYYIQPQNIFGNGEHNIYLFRTGLRSYHLLLPSEYGPFDRTVRLAMDMLKDIRKLNDSFRIPYPKRTPRSIKRLKYKSRLATNNNAVSPVEFKQYDSDFGLKRYAWTDDTPDNGYVVTVARSSLPNQVEVPQKKECCISRRNCND